MATIPKRAVPAAALTAATALLLIGCGDEGQKNKYDIKGTVTARNIDYDCTRVQGRAATKALTAPGKNSGGTSGGRSSTSGGSGSNSGNRNGGGGGAHKALPKPKKINPKVIPHGGDQAAIPANSSCTKDYELYVKNHEGVFEQEVPSRHWIPCEEKKKFPRCITTGKK